MALPPLRTVNVGNALAQGTQLREQERQSNALRETDERNAQIRGLFTGGLPTDTAGRADLVNQVIAIDPDTGFSLSENFAKLNEADRAQVTAEGQTLGRLLFGVDSPAGFAAALGEAERLGIDVTRLREAGFSPALVQGTVNAARDLEKVIESAEPEIRTVGDTLLSVQNGQATPIFTAPQAPKAQFEDVLDANGNVIAQRNLETGRVTSDPRNPGLVTPERLQQLMDLRAAGKPQTSVTVGGDTVNLTTGARTEVQKDTLATQDFIARLDTIAAGFKPEFLTLEGQIGQGINAFRERNLESLGVGELSEEQRTSLREYTTFRRNTTNNLSRFVQELSGAAVTPQEAERLSASLPTIDDSPTEFQAKLNASIMEANRALARFNFALKNGLDPLNSGIPLAAIDTLIDSTADDLRRELQGTVPAEELDAAIETRLRETFGI